MNVRPQNLENLRAYEVPRNVRSQRSKDLRTLRGCFAANRKTPAKFWQWNSAYKIILLTYVSLVLGLITVAPVSAQEKPLEWKPFEEAIELAEENQKPVLVDVWAPWCGWCKKMQKEVYPELSRILNEEFILTRLNRDDNESKKHYQNHSLTPLRLAQKLNVESVPAIVVLSAEGEYLFHISGFIEAEKLVEVLDQIISALPKTS